MQNTFARATHSALGQAQYATIGYLVYKEKKIWLLFSDIKSKQNYFQGCLLLHKTYEDSIKEYTSKFKGFLLDGFLKNSTYNCFQLSYYIFCMYCN